MHIISEFFRIFKNTKDEFSINIFVYFKIFPLVHKHIDRAEFSAATHFFLKNIIITFTGKLVKDVKKGKNVLEASIDK